MIYCKLYAYSFQGVLICFKLYKTSPKVDLLWQHYSLLRQHCVNLKVKSSKWQPHLETANLAVSPGNASKSEHDILQRITSKISGSWKQSPHPPTQTEIFLSCKLDMSYPITFPFSFSSFLSVPYLHTLHISFLGYFHMFWLFHSRT